MTPVERSARFRAVVARAMAKPLAELPYLAPVTSRFHYGGRPTTGELGRLTRSFGAEINAAKARKKRRNLVALPGPTSMPSGDLTPGRRLRARPEQDRKAQREETSVPLDDDPGLLEYHEIDGKKSVRFSHDES